MQNLNDNNSIVQNQMENRQSFYNRNKKRIWSGLITLAVVTAGAIAAIIIFGNGNGADFREDVDFKIEGPSEAVSGSEITYELAIDNKSSSVLSDIVVEFFYPQGFLPAENIGRSLSLSDLEEGKTHTIEIRGTLTGSVQEIKVMSAKLRYIPSTFRSIFEKESKVQTLVLAPDLSLELSAPAQIVTGQNIEYDLIVENLTERMFPEIVLKFEFPENFTPESEQSEWQISNLEPDGVFELKIRGRLASEPGRESLAKAQLFIPNDEGVLQLVTQDFVLVQVDAVPLRVSHSVKNQDEALYPGEVLEYQVRYENTGRIALRNVEITLSFAADVFALAQLKKKSGRLEGSSLIWSSDELPVLSVITPGESGIFEFSVPISANLEQRLEKNPQARTVTRFRATEFQESLPGSELVLPVRTDLAVSGTAAHLGGNRYRISLVVSNTVNDVQAAILTARLAGLDSEFDAESAAPAGEKTNVQYNNATKLLQWDLDEIFAFSGSFHSPRTLIFEITSSSNVLLRDIEVRGIDSFVGIEVSDSLGELKAN